MPAYADWIPHPDESSVDGAFEGVYSVEMEAMFTSAGDDDEETVDDPMLTNPAVVALVSAFSWWGLAEQGLGEPVLGPAAREEEPDPDAVPAKTHCFVGQNQVYLGSFDDADLQAAVDDGNFSETGTSGVYAYDDGDTVVTWGSDYVVLGPDVDRVTAVVDAGTGAIDRRHEVDPHFEWLLSTAGHGDFTVATLSTSETVDLDGGGDDSDADFSMFEGSKGFAQTASFDAAGEQADAWAAVVYAGEDRVDRDRLESSLGTESNDRTVDEDGRTVTINASYGDWTGDGSDGGTDDGDSDDADSDTGDDSTDDDTDESTGDGDDTGDDDSGGDGDDSSDESDTDGDDETDGTSDDDDGSNDDSSGDGDQSDDSSGDGSQSDTDGDDGTEDGSNDGRETDTRGSDEDEDDSVPGPGILGAVASIGGVGYLLSRRLENDERAD